MNTKKNLLESLVMSFEKRNILLCLKLSNYLIRKDTTSYIKNILAAEIFFPHKEGKMNAQRQLAARLLSLLLNAAITIKLKAHFFTQIYEILFSGECNSNIYANNYGRLYI